MYAAFGWKGTSFFGSAVFNDDDQKKIRGHIVEINEGKAKNPYLKEVQKALVEYADVFLRLYEQDYSLGEVLPIRLSWL